ncbi:hypothetical protein R3I94_001288 [Phoxinus phoxinus]|uniref:Uncharacterized protein n=1 Tax=Phoxinus phoxinus TaxID=58324 RepID=A0AAN9HLV6_9TELE
MAPPLLTSPVLM